MEECRRRRRRQRWRCSTGEASAWIARAGEWDPLTGACNSRSDTWESNGCGSNGRRKRQHPGTQWRGRVDGNSFSKCVDLILKKSKLKLSGRELREQNRVWEPSLKPLNCGFTKRGWLMQLLNIKTKHKTFKEANKTSKETNKASWEARFASKKGRKGRMVKGEMAEGRGEGGRSRRSLLPWKPVGKEYLEERERREFLSVNGSRIYSLFFFFQYTIVSHRKDEYRNWQRMLVVYYGSLSNIIITC